MKKYRVKVNGKVFNVLLESVEEVTGTIVEEAKQEIQSSDVVEGTKSVSAPIQGNIIDVLVNKGQKVKKGDVLLLIEAMKLENEVNAPVDGEIVEILVTKGQNVSSNQLLVKIK